MQLLRGERQERREEHLERIDGSQGGVDRLGGFGFVALDLDHGEVWSRYWLTAVASFMASPRAERRCTASSSLPTDSNPLSTVLSRLKSMGRKSVLGHRISGTCPSQCL